MPERILLMGAPTSGKSTCIKSIAALCHKLKKDVRIKVMDSDNRAEMQLDGLPNVDVHVPMDWPDYVAKTREWVKTVRKTDFIVLDMVDFPWDAVQRHYVETVLHTDIETMTLQYKEQQLAKGKKGAGSPLLEHYNSINMMYFGWQQLLLPRNPCHIIATVPVKKVNDGDAGGWAKDDQATLNLYLAEGMKPGGQSKLGHFFNTIHLIMQPKVGVHKIVTIREIAESRREKRFDRDDLTDYAKQYLWSVAGWRP